MGFMTGSPSTPPPPPPPLPPANPPVLASSQTKQSGAAQRAAQQAAAGSYADTLKTSSQGAQSDLKTAGKALLSGEK